MAEPSDSDSESDSSGRDAPIPESDSHFSGAWPHLVPLAWAILASAALHGGGLLVVHSLANLAIDFDAEVEWLEGADDLTGFGQKDSERFVKADEIPEEPERDGNSELDKRLEEALEGTDQPPESPHRDSEPSRAKSTTDPEGRSKPQKNEPKRKEEPTDEETSKSGSPDPEPFSNVSEHRALNRTGPNDLPDMRSFAPGNSRLSALIRVDRVRDQPYEEVLRHILRNVPDYRLLLDIPEFDPVDDMDWFFMASPNPRYIQHTFLAVRHNLSTGRVRKLLDRRYPEPPPWSTFRTFPVRDLVPKNPDYRDPRRILLTKQGMALVAKGELLAEIVEPLDGNSPLLYPSGPPGGEQPSRGAEADRGNPRQTALLEGLARIHQVAHEDDTVVLMSARGIKNARFPGVGALPPIESVRMSVANPDQPTLELDLKFKDASGAESFRDQCPAMRDAIENAVPGSSFCGLSSLLERLECSVDDSFVTVSGDLPADQLARLGSCASFAIPQPPALDELPRPKRTESPDSDAGSPP